MKKIFPLIIIFLLILTINNSVNSQVITHFPWTESFEEASFPSAGWTKETEDDNGYGWIQDNGSSHGPGTVIDGNKAAMADVYNIKKNKTAKLKTPTLKLGSLSSPKLKLYWQCSTGYGQDPVFIIKMSKDNGITFSEIYNQTADGIADNWLEINIDLTGATDQTILSFEAISDWGSKNLFIDNILVYEPTPMQFVEAKSFQNNTNVISIGTENNDILGINIKTQGSLNKLVLKQLDLNITGTSQLTDISKVKIYYTKKTNVFSPDTLFSKTTTIQNSLSLNGNIELNEGDNYFWIAFDINSNAIKNNIVDAECLNVKINDSIYTVDIPLPDGNRQLKKILNMQAGNNTILVNDSILFFDNGGVSANYSENFEGTITFIPATTGKSIKIEWNNFEIFNTSSIGKNDIFKIYNGDNTNENNLIGIYSEMPPSIYSMDTNGALTVYFKVKTGVPKSGWNACVSEITPQNMKYLSSNIIQADTNIVSCGDKNTQILKIKIITENTLNPITIENINLSTNGSSSTKDISTAKVYYTFNKNTFDTTNLFGIKNNPNGTFNITGNQHLTVGENYFWLTYDISELAANNNIIDAECHSVTISSKEKFPNISSPEGYRTINNTYRMPKTGTVTKTIYQEISFTDDNEGYGGKYSYDANSTVTFYPTNSQEKIKIEFSSFDILYEKSPYGTKAVFKIFNGISTASSDLIWKADENNCTKGPGYIITSTSDKGAITIQFAGNAYSSYKTKNGWEAKIWSEEPKNMEYKSINVSQIDNIAKLGGANQKILKINLNLSGTLNPINNAIFKFNTNGSSNNSDITAAKLYFTDKKNIFSLNNQVGTTITSPNGEFSFHCSNSLEEGNNYFWLVYDISQTATIGNVIDAELTEIKLKNDIFIINNGNPYGNRIIKNIYNLETGKHEINITQTVLDFFDEGGMSNKYSKNCKDTVVFTPVNNTEKTKLIISKLNLNSSDKLVIYNGDIFNDENILAELSGNDNITSSDDPYIFKSNTINGKLSVAFKSSSYSTPKDGWKATAYSFTPQAVYYKDAEILNYKTNPVIKNEQNAEILKIKLNFAGETSPANISEFKFSIGGTSNINDIKKTYLFYSKQVNEFNPENSILIGDTIPDVNGNISFSCNVNIKQEAGYYFWLTYNISSDAKAGNYVDASLVKITVNDKNKQILNGNPDGNRKIIGGLKGNYTIDKNGNGDFKSFNEAINQLVNKGIEGNVNFLIEDNVYVEKIVIPEIQGSSKNSIITFKAKNQIKENVKIVYNSKINSSYTEPYGIITLTGADFVHFENITFKTSKKDYKGIFVIRNQSRDIKIISSTFIAPFCKGYSDISAIYLKADNIANHNNDRLTIQNCEFNGSATALSLSGTGYVALPKEKGHKIIGCVFKNQGRKIAWIDNQKDIQFSDNLIFIDNNNISEMIAVVGYRVIGKSLFKNNIIRSSINKKIIGFQFRPAIGTENHPIKIFNNIINLKNAGKYSVGIEFDDASQNAEIFYNTVLITGIGSSTASLKISGKTTETPKNLTFKNNLFINKTNSYSIIINKSSFLKSITFDYNNLYSAGKNLCKNESSNITDINQWKNLTKAINSISEIPVFYSNNDLHLKSIGNLNRAVKIEYINSDIDNETRPEQKPTIGADEFAVPDSNAPVFNNKYPYVSNITHVNALLNVKTNKNGIAYFVVLNKNAKIPSIQQIIEGKNADGILLSDNLKDSIEFFKNKKSSITIKNLQSHKKYNICIAIKDNLENITDSITQIPFQTNYRLTEPSTFELITTGSDNFEDGTAFFSNVNVIKGSGVDIYSNKYIQIPSGQEATISITNTSLGLILNGLFLKSNSTIRITGIKKDNTYTKPLIINAFHNWDYVDLTELKKVIGIKIYAISENCYIDNFSSLPLPLSIEPLTETTINAGEHTELKVIAKGGVKPYTYKWSSATYINNDTIYNPIATPQYTTIYNVVVTDKMGEKVNGSVKINVLNKQAFTADFENLQLQPESHWNGNPNKENSLFYSGSFSFNNYYKEHYLTWAGFAYSNETSTSFNSIDDQFHSAVGVGALKSKNYAVVYSYGFVPEINLTNTDEGDIIKGMYITNTAYALSSMKNGDGFIGEKFKKGDWYSVTFSGRDKDGNITSSIEVYLADYRSENPNDHYILDYWKWIDLSSLGKVQKIYISVDGSRNNSLGLLIPTYLCIDNFNCSKTDMPPFVKNKIPNISIENEGDKKTIDISKTFSDYDNNDKNIITSIKSISNNKILTATLNNNLLDITLISNDIGEDVKFIIEAESNNKTVTDTFSVTVIEDIPPTVSNPIPDISVKENSADSIISLTNVFTDADNDDSQIVKTVKSNTNQSLVNTSISGNNLTLSFTPNSIGQAEIVIEAVSNGKTVTDTFNVTVTKESLLAVVNPIPDISVKENSADTTISLVNVFTYTGKNNLQIIKTVKSNSNQSLVNTSISGNNLTLSFAANSHGQAEIVIEAVSNGKTVTDTFNVTVNEDISPIVANPIPDISVNENAGDSIISLTNVFTDADNDDSQIVKTVKNNSNQSLVNTSISGNNLTLSFTPNSIGQAKIVIEAVSNGKTVTDTFNVTVIEDVSPIVVNPIPDISVNENAGDSIISLTNVFTDADNDDSQIVKTVKNNSNQSLVNTSISGNNLTLSFIANSHGQAEIVIEAESNGKTVTDTFNVTVLPTSIYNNITGIDYIIYPNPTNGKFRIKTNNNVKNTVVSIYSLQGKLVYYNKFYSNSEIIDISLLPAGVYKIKIQHNKQTVIKTVIIK